MGDMLHMLGTEKSAEKFKHSCCKKQGLPPAILFGQGNKLGETQKEL